MEIKKQIYIITSAFLLIALFLVLFLVAPMIKGITQSSEELISQRNDGLILESQFNEAANFKQKYESYQPNLEKLDNMFIDSHNPVNFIEFLEKTASDFQIKLLISTPSLSKEGPLSYDNFQLSSSGNFSDTLKFIRTLESGPYLVKINKLNVANIKSAKTADQKGKVAADISIKVFAK